MNQSAGDTLKFKYCINKQTNTDYKWTDMKKTQPKS